jgi:hypothetical protein
MAQGVEHLPTKLKILWFNPQCYKASKQTTTKNTIIVVSRKSVVKILSQLFIILKY